MALTYATGFTTNKLASAVNIWWDRNAIALAPTNNGILFAMALLQSKGPATSPDIGGLIVRKQRIEGNQIVARNMGKTAIWSGVADANELDSVTLTDTTDAFGGQVWDWAHFFCHVPYTTSHRAIIRGEAARTNSWLDDLMLFAREGWYDALDTGIMSANDATRSTIGGLRYAIDTTGTYGGINRALSGNERFQAACNMTISNPTTADYDTMRLKIVQGGGFRTPVDGFVGVGVMGLTPYKLLMQELKGYQSYMTETWNKFPSVDKIGYGGVIHVFDHKGSDTDAFYIDPRACRLYLDTSLTAKGPVPIPDVKSAAEVFIFDYWCQFIVGVCAWTGRISGITGA